MSPTSSSATRSGTTRSIDFEVHDAALSARARFARLLDAKQLQAVTAASSAQLQAAIGRHDTAALERYARPHRLLLVVDGRTYGERLANAVTARGQLVRHGSGIGAAVAQLPVDSRTRRIVSAGAPNGVRVVFVDYPTTGTLPAGQGETRPVASHVAVHAYLPASIESHRKNAAYRRVAEAGLLALLALMLLTLVLTRPLLRAFRWTEEQASEARIDALTGLANRRALEDVLAAEISRAQRFQHELAVVVLDLDSRHSRARETRSLAGAARSSSSSCPRRIPRGAIRFAERLRRTIEAHNVGEMQTTTSCGVARMLPEDTVEDLLAAADQALYGAKSNGRNRTENAVGGPRPTPA